MREAITRYIKNCDVCQRIKATRHAPYGLLQPLEVPQQPWKSIAMDFVTGLPESEGYDAIWVVIDRLTKMAHFVPCHTSIKAEEFGRLFIQNIFRLHGMPHDIVSDRGSLFTSEFWKKATEGRQIQRKLSTAFHPQTDGQTERTNAIMEQYL